jgi:hypothetical protein
VTNCHQLKPDHESQIRPLVGLTPEQAKLAWERAVEKAGGRRITARVVKSAVQDLHFGGAPKAANRQTRQTRAGKRKLINETIGQILVLLL